jgi:hypothetical protein
VGVGTLGAISPIEETKSVVANGVSLSLSGIPEEMIALAMGEKYRGRNVYIWMALFNVSDGTLILNPEQVFAGRLDTMSISDAGETSTITIACESRLIDLERSRERRYTNEDQKYLYPADASLRYVAGLQGKEFPWGVKDVYIGHDGRTLASETLDPANLFGSNNRNNFFDPIGLFG